MNAEDQPPITDTVPFIKMLYTEDGKRKVFDCNWPEMFIQEFEGVHPSQINVAYFFAMGQLTKIKNLTDARNFCKA